MTTTSRKYLTWVVKDDGTGIEYNCVLKDNSIHDDLKDLNHGTVYTVHNFNADDRVQVLEKNAATSRVLLDGYVKDQSVKYSGASAIIVYQQEVHECAERLVTMRVKSGTSYTVNLSGNADQMVDTVLSGTGWVRKSTIGGAALPNEQLYYTTVMKALEHIVLDQAASTYYMWFETSPSFAVCYGEYRTDRSATNTTKYLDFKVSKNTVKKNVGAVTILGSGGVISGMFPTAYAGNDMMVYQYDAATSADSCAAWAKRIWQDLAGATATRGTLELDPASAYIGSGWVQEGDKIKVDGTTYIVMDIVYKQDKVSLGLNAYRMDIFDRLGDDLVEVSGNVRQQNYLSWDGGWDNVSGTPGIVTEWTINIGDLATIGPSFNLTLTSASYRTYATPASTSFNTDRLSDVSNIVTTTTRADEAVLVDSFYIPDGDGVVLTTMANGYQFGVVHIYLKSFIIATTGTLYLRVLRKYTGGGWVEVGVQTIDVSSGSWEPISVPILIDGSTTAESAGVVDCYITVYVLGLSGQIKSLGNSAAIRRVPRHLHSAVVTPQQTNNVVDTGATPTALQININAASWCAWALPAGSSYSQTQNIVSKLVSGINTIRVQTNVTGTAGSARVTANYSVYGK